MKFSEIQTDIVYRVVRSSNDGSLQKGDLVFKDSDYNDLTIPLKSGAYLDDEADLVLEGTVLEVDESWSVVKEEWRTYIRRVA